MTQSNGERALYQRYMLGSSTTRGIAEALAGTRGATAVKRRWGMISAVNTDDTVDVDLAGVVIPRVRRSAYYTPTVGERVWLDVVGTDVVVVSPTAPSAANVYAVSTHNHDTSYAPVSHSHTTVANADGRSFAQGTDEKFIAQGPFVDLVCDRRYGAALNRVAFVTLDTAGLALNPSIVWYRTGINDRAWMVSTSNNSGLIWGLDSLYATNGTGGNGPIGASAFNTTSSRSLKRNITAIPETLLDAFENVPNYSWEYENTPGVRHFGPMAEDLPEDLVSRTEDVPGGLMVNIGDLVGVTKGVVQRQRVKIQGLETRLAAAEQEIARMRSSNPPTGSPGG